MLKVTDVSDCCEKSKEVSDAFEYPSEEHKGTAAHMYSILNPAKQYSDFFLYACTHSCMLGNSNTSFYRGIEHENNTGKKK